MTLRLTLQSLKLAFGCLKGCSAHVLLLNAPSLAELAHSCLKIQTLSPCESWLEGGGLLLSMLEITYLGCSFAFDVY